MTKWSRRRHVAEAIGSDLADVAEFQPSLRGAEKRVPIFDVDGDLVFVKLPGDTDEKIRNAIGERQWKIKPAWYDTNVIVYSEKKS